jgi:hypothetical protein
MTALLTVDTAAMDELARQLRALAVRARGGRADLGVAPALIAALAAPGLIQAAGTFLERWQAPVAALIDDAERLADAVDLLTRSYQDVESVAERGLIR